VAEPSIKQRQEGCRVRGLAGPSGVGRLQRPEIQSLRDLDQGAGHARFGQPRV
jgi:hypothetical protein